ncbi:carbohydrate-binding module family 14 protein [Anianabacter salinae]|uniref:carbohydrate-binding module family 14 protein n=1 Tax=Anianabacter salinae TaxID=2851023 RepID=UPI00225E1DB0|nr:carbohydrate-binding module family 14 protein [Anianabacter salinae]MBV0912911.1 carbohydrate-binding module family 14 protein [Anianabacter salinae]
MFKVFLSAVFVTAAPLAAFAQCSSGHVTAQSCAEGQMWDAPSASCVPITS